MKRISMKKLIALLLCLSPFAQADILADGSLTFGVDTKSVTISTTSASPTQIFINDPYVTRSWIINDSTYTLFISSVTTISTGSFAIPPSTVFSPDGPAVPYWGPLWAFLGIGPGQAGVVTPGIASIFRSK